LWSRKHPNVGASRNRLRRQLQVARSYFPAPKQRVAEITIHAAPRIGRLLDKAVRLRALIFRSLYMHVSTAPCWKFAWVNKLNASARNFNRTVVQLGTSAPVKSTSRNTRPAERIEFFPGKIEKFTFVCSNLCVGPRRIPTLRPNENVNPSIRASAGDHDRSTPRRCVWSIARGRVASMVRIGYVAVP